MIALEHATVVIGKRTCLEDVSFTLEAGEMLLVIGPPEGGKTTLVRALAGLVPMRTGTLTCNGERIDLQDPDTLSTWQRRVGVAFQNDALFDASTTFENVAFPLEQRGITGEARHEKVQRRLEEVGLWAARDKLPAELSGGMRKRCGIARAVVIEPDVGLFDDPTAGLDPLSSARVLDLLVELRRDLALHTVVVSNELDVALPITTKVLMLHKGKALFSGTPAELRASNEPHVRQFVRGADDGPL
ncbi:MAG TPA: ATP-binding cassette domain-containing protein [Myxococcota bacterium]|nr:ATP-binding cassette domain-containing protein [Myxococcota bacterium]